jgi:hypothetical protein
MIKTLQYFQTPWGYFEIASYSLLETKIIESLEFQEGLFFGKPRFGHPEGKIILHIREVLQNVESLKDTVSEKRFLDLRLVSLLHDTFKNKVNETQPHIGKNHHSYFAKKFAEKYIQEEAVLQVIQHHDDAYHAWGRGEWYGNWEGAEENLEILVGRLGKNLQFFYEFFKCDTQTGNKDFRPLTWFEEKLANRIEKVEFSVSSYQEFIMKSA